VLAHQSHREIRAVRDAEHVPLVDPECHAQIRHISRVLGCVVGVEVGPRRDQASVTGAHRRHVLARGLGSVKRKTKGGLRNPVDPRARRRRVRRAVERPALAQDNQIMVAVEACVDQRLRLVERVATRAACQIHDRVGCGRLRDRRHYPDRQADRAPVRLGPVLGDNEEPAVRGRWQRGRKGLGRARGCLESRHSGGRRRARAGLAACRWMTHSRGGTQGEQRSERDRNEGCKTPAGSSGRPTGHRLPPSRRGATASLCHFERFTTQRRCRSPHGVMPVMGPWEDPRRGLGGVGTTFS
jgi:hypothetical protein